MATDITFAGRWTPPSHRCRSNILTFHQTTSPFNLVAFEWADSQDAKEWDRLKAILAPSVRLDFRPLHGVLHESISPDKFVTMVSDQKVIGDPLVKTQHFLGGSTWERLSENEISIKWQARVAHQRYKDASFAEAVNHGHGHAVAEHTYRKGEHGKWKLTGLRSNIRWTEYDLFGTLNPEGK